MRKILCICLLAAGAMLVQAAGGFGPDLRRSPRNAQRR